jgi:hypothetical protein
MSLEKHFHTLSQGTISTARFVQEACSFFGRRPVQRSVKNAS